MFYNRGTNNKVNRLHDTAFITTKIEQSIPTVFSCTICKSCIGRVVYIEVSEY